MDRDDARDLENQDLRIRLTRLSEASLRITEDLDLDAVLQRVVDGARLLTGASRGGLTVIDDAGQLEALLSSGLTEEAHRGFVELPGGLELFAYLSNLPEPLRVDDFSAHSEALGLPEIGPPLEPLGSFLSAPILLQGTRVGNPLPIGQAGRRRGSPRRTRTRWCSSPPRRPWPSPTPAATGGAAGQGRPGDADRHLSRGRRGVRREDGRARLHQPGDAEDRRRPARPRPAARAPPGGADRHPRRRHGDLPGGAAPGPGPLAPARRFGPRRSSCGCPTAGALGRCSTPRPSARRRARWSPSWRSFRT